jgi:quercetin dioxygenase-like cupin family protein
MRIETKDEAGKPNGYVITIWNEREDDIVPPAQVYVTAIAPGCRKGPHLHMKRRGLFTCIKGNVKIITRNPEGTYRVHHSGETHNYRRVEVPPGTVAALYNEGTEDALVINMPTPAWAKDDQDEWPVKGWRC